MGETKHDGQACDGNVIEYYEISFEDGEREERQEVGSA